MPSSGSIDRPSSLFSPSMAASSRGQRNGQRTPNTGSFRFPQSSSREDPTAHLPDTFEEQPIGIDPPIPSVKHPSSVRPWNGDSNNPMIPVNRIISNSSVNGSTRSSGEFYSLSNNSSETLGSEYPTQPSASLFQRALPFRQPSFLSPGTRKPSAKQTLMMGYAQVVGSFTLDGSLVNQAPFEEVKRKGVVGGQGGGGVVGLEESKRQNGLFGSFGWGNLGESIGGLLKGGELSSIKEMRGVANSRSIPLLTTPQSILFVDLQLHPGQSKSYQFRFTLPRGLPASHKGKAIKIVYNLVIGTQRPGTLQDRQNVRHVNIPIKVFPGVNCTFKASPRHYPR